jgi:Flp pilus assembly protein TadG
VRRPAAPRRRRRRGERGSALVEFIWLGILLIVPLVWVVMSIFEVQRGAFAVSAAARAAGRAYALAGSDAEGAARARAAARQALADQGLDAAPLEITVACSPYPHSCHAGTSVVTVRVASSVGLPWLPSTFGLGSPDFALDATHTVPIGQYQEIGDATE